MKKCVQLTVSSLPKSKWLFLCARYNLKWRENLEAFPQLSWYRIIGFLCV